MAERALPPGWWKTVDANSGKSYYYTADGKRQWHFPGDAEPEGAEEPPASTARDLGKERDTGRSKINVVGDAGGYERSIMKCVLKVVLFPFESIVKALIWIIPQVIFIIFELVVGFVCLKGRAEYSYLRFWNEDYTSSDTPRAAFLAIFLIVDAFVWMGENILHFLLLFTVAPLLLSNPPSFSASPLELFNNVTQSTPKGLYLVNLVFFFLFRIFQLVWTIIAGFKFALMGINHMPGVSISGTIKEFEAGSNLLRGVAVVFITVNCVSLTLWAFFLGILLYLRSHGKNLLGKAA